METRSARILLGGWTVLVVLFLWMPLLLIMVYAFNKANVQSWPIPGFTTHWFGVGWHSSEVRQALFELHRGAPRPDVGDLARPRPAAPHGGDDLDRLLRIARDEEAQANLLAYLEARPGEQHRAGRADVADDRAPRRALPPFDLRQHAREVPQLSASLSAHLWNATPIDGSRGTTLR